MVSVRRSTIIDAPVDRVWSILRDFNGHDRWHPAVERSVLEAGYRTDQVGAVRNFVLTTGETVRERLLSFSETDRSFRYAIVESGIPLRNYVADLFLKPVTDGDQTFWSWQSRFDAPPDQATALSALVAENIYEAGFEAIRARVARAPPVGPDIVETSSAATASMAPSTLSGTAMIIERYGGPAELRAVPVNAPAPGPGQVRIRQTAVGVNFIDVYCRTGYFDLIALPGAPGVEAAGIVVDIGRGVQLAPGQRVAYACLPPGAYASVRTMDAALVIPLPDTIDDEMAAAGLLKGMTAEILLHRVHAVRPGEVVLVYAPAGGVGRLLCQWARHLGATVIGATSRADKARRAKAAGANHVILPGEASLEAQVRALTGGQGADVIFDAVGRDSFAHSVAALAQCGHLVSFGQASGPIGHVDIDALATMSATVSRPVFAHFADRPEKVAAITDRLFDAIDRDIVAIDEVHRYPLSQAAEAHRALEQRETTGSLVLIPEDSD